MELNSQQNKMDLNNQVINSNLRPLNTLRFQQSKDLNIKKNNNTISKISNKIKIITGDNTTLNTNNYEIQLQNNNIMNEKNNINWNIKQDINNNLVLQNGIKDVLFIDTQGNIIVNGKIKTQDT